MKNKNYSSIRLEITSKCNINCSYCHNSDYSFKCDDMTTSDILKLVYNLKKNYPVKKILLTGGEPLLNKEIYKIIKFITNLGIKCDMVTNGKLLNEEVVNKLVDSGLKRIRISIDGFEEHKLYRVGSDPYKLWDISKWIVENKEINVCIHTVSSPHNVHKLYDIYKKVLEVGAHRWRVFDIGFMGGAKHNKNNLSFENYYNIYFEQSKYIIRDYINNFRYEKLNMDLERIFIYDHLKMKRDDIKEAFSFWKEKELNNNTCSYINHQLTIRSNGVGTLCQYFHNTIYDFKKYDYDIEESVKNSNFPIETTLQEKELSDCIGCKYYGLCGRGCRNNALFLTGDIRNADPIACYFSKRRYEELKHLLPKETQKCMDYFYDSKGKNPKYDLNDLIKFFKIKGYI